MASFELKSPVLYIFGAGATRGSLTSELPPPVDTDFFESIGRIKGHGTQRLAKKVLNEAWKLYGSRLDLRLEEYYRDIETRAVIQKFAKSANQPKDWLTRQKDLEELIRRVYIHTTCDLSTIPSKPRESIFHKKILSAARERDSIVTFNYDLVIEESFEKGDLWNPRDGYGIKANNTKGDWCRKWCEKRKVKPGKKSRILLLKLHGSLNWTLYNNQHVRLKPRPYVVRTKGGKPSFDQDVGLVVPKAFQ